MKNSKISLKDLDIQLKRNVKHLIPKCSRFHQNPSLGYSHPGPNSELKIELPKKFRELRALAIVMWYLPEELRFLIQVELQINSPYFLDFENKGLENSLEILIFSTSKEIMLNYLIIQQEIDPRELFGTILFDDILRAHENFKFYWKVPSKARRKVRRKGYRDQGSRKPDHKWKESFDVTFTEYQKIKEEKEELFFQQYHSILEELESQGPDS